MTPLILAALICAQPPIKAPGTAPSLSVVHIKDKMLVTEVTVMEPRTVKVKEKVTKGGMEVEVEVVKTVVNSVKKTISTSLEGMTFQTADGKKIAIEEAAKRLKTPTLVVVSADGRPVDATFLAVLKPTTIVIVAGTPTVPVAPPDVIRRGPPIED